MREEGYYWVKYKGRITIGHYDKVGAWLLIGTDDVIPSESKEKDDLIITIEGRLIPPEEYCPKCKSKRIGFTLDDGKRYECTDCGHDWEQEHFTNG